MKKYCILLMLSLSPIMTFADGDDDAASVRETIVLSSSDIVDGRKEILVVGAKLNIVSTKVNDKFTTVVLEDRNANGQVTLRFLRDSQVVTLLSDKQTKVVELVKGDNGTLMQINGRVVAIIPEDVIYTSDQK